ncbi:MAG: DinB family protein [Actinomycetota bacterium]
MPVIGRDEAIRTLDEGNRQVRDLAGQLSDDQLTRPASIGGGDWSARDLLGHLTTWEEVALEALQEWRDGNRPRVETEIFGTDEGVDTFNAQTVEAKRQRSAEEIRDAAERVHEALRREIESMSDGEWRARAPYATERRRTLAELLGSVLGAPRRPFGHAFAHLDDLRAYVDSAP